MTRFASSTAADLLRFIIRAMITAVIVALSTALLVATADLATAIRGMYPLLVFALPVAAGLITTLCTAFAPTLRSVTGPALTLIRSTVAEEHPPAKKLPLTILATFIVHLAGGSTGRTGVTIQTSTSLALALDDGFGPSEDRKAVVHGALSAAVAALFCAPVTGVLFSLTLTRLRSLKPNAIISALISAPIGTVVGQWAGIIRIGTTPPLPLHFSFTTLLTLLLFSIILALVSRLYVTLILAARIHVAASHKRSVISASVLLLFYLTTHLTGYGTTFSGLSIALIGEAGLTTSALTLSLFKLIATVLTVAAGFIGGEFLPALVIGTTLGSTLGPLLGLPLSTAAMLGAAGVLSGVSNLPFACIALSLELFGQVAIIPTILVAFTTRSLSGSPSIFDSAKPIDRVSISS